jgi:hypothetical protein
MSWTLAPRAGCVRGEGARRRRAGEGHSHALGCCKAMKNSSKSIYKKLICPICLVCLESLITGVYNGVFRSCARGPGSDENDTIKH